MPGLITEMRRKADELALEADKKIRINRKQGEINQLRKRIQQQIATLGKTAYRLHQEGLILAPELEELCKVIDGLHGSIAALETEIKAIEQETLPPSTPASSAITCPRCRNAISADALFCPHCGLPRAQFAPSPAMQTCDNCGNSIPIDAKFCAHCGAAVLPKKSKSITCTHCGAELPAAALFCSECGQRVQSDASATETLPAPDMVAPAPESTEARQAKSLTSETREDVEANAAEETIVIDAHAGSLPTEPHKPQDQSESIIDDESDHEPAEAVKPCPSCSSEIPVEAIFCPVCGTAVE